MSQYEGEVLIAIDGPGGGGKTELAETIVRGYGLDPTTQIIHGDHFYEPGYLGADVVGDIPNGFNSTRFMQEIGGALLAGSDLQVRAYDFGIGDYIELPKPERGALIVAEGIKLLSLPIEWDLKIWVETPRDLREERFMNRDGSKRRELKSTPETLRRRFHQWADDAEAYEAMIDPHGRPDVLIIDGTATKQQQLLAISQALAVVAELA